MLEALEQLFSRLLRRQRPRRIDGGAQFLHRALGLAQRQILGAGATLDSIGQPFKLALIVGNRPFLGGEPFRIARCEPFYRGVEPCAYVASRLAKCLEMRREIAPARVQRSQGDLGLAEALELRSGFRGRCKLFEVLARRGGGRALLPGLRRFGAGLVEPGAQGVDFGRPLVFDNRHTFPLRARAGDIVGFGVGQRRFHLFAQGPPRRKRRFADSFAGAAGLFLREPLPLSLQFELAARARPPRPPAGPPRLR